MGVDIRSSGGLWKPSHAHPLAYSITHPLAGGHSYGSMDAAKPNADTGAHAGGNSDKRRAHAYADAFATHVRMGEAF